MASFQVPWYRIIVFTLLIAAVAWWIHYRDVQVVDEEPRMPPGAVGPTTAEVKGLVVLDILPYEVKGGEPPAFWIRLGNEAWDVQVPGTDVPPDVLQHAKERRVDVFEGILEQLEDLRLESGDADALAGEIRRGASVPSSLYMEAFQAFIGAGFGTVNMAVTESKPPGARPR